MTGKQGDLFGGTEAATVVDLPRQRARFEVHEHCFISGPRRGTVRHSHEGGSEPHQHPNTGPASYTIDKDEWRAMTGAEGGGRKEFTDAPEGDQFERVELADWQKTFEVHVGDPPPGFVGSGGGMFAAARMILACRMTVSNVVPFPGKPRKVAT